MGLSSEERAGLLAEARDAQRRDRLRLVWREQLALRPPDLLAWLSASAEWLAPFATAPRPRIRGDHFLL